MQATNDRGRSIEPGVGDPGELGPKNSPPDMSAIERLIGTARRRIRVQWALEGATTAAIVSAAATLAVIFAMRMEVVERATGLVLLVGAAAIVGVGAVLSASRRIDDEGVARRIDRASHLADRLSTAVAFSRAALPADGDETHELMRAAIRDGVRAAPRADVKRATPLAAPRDLRVALGFIALSALVAGLAIPTVDRAPHLYRVDPDHGAPGDEVALWGRNLMTGLARPIASLPAQSALGAPDVPAEATAPPVPRGFVPPDGAVTIGAGKAVLARVLDWAPNRIAIRIPDDAPVGPTTLTAWIAGAPVGRLPFTVIDRKDVRYHKADSVVLDPEDRAYLEALLGELKATARRDHVPELDEFAKQIEQLIRDAELGKISKEKMLEALARAEARLDQNAEPDQAEVDKQLAELGKLLAKNQLTKQLGEALQNTELDKARQELEKLADKLENNQLSEKAQEKLAEQLEKAAKQLAAKQQQAQNQHDQKQQKLEDEIRRLEKKKQEAKTEQEQLDAERQLNKKKDELKKLEKDQQDKDQSAQRQALKRLSRDLEKAAEDLQKKQDPQDPQDKDGQQQDADKQNRAQQASQKLKDAARETGRVDRDRRKQATQRKMSSQMEDLREAMRRAKQKGNSAPRDPFGKQNKNRDFAQRAKGQRGQSSAWKPGQGQQGQGQPGQGQQANGKQWGVGHDDNLVGDPTPKSGHTKDTDLQGTQGSQGGGTRETILSAAQKGFASERYRDVYGKYNQIVEEVMRTEKLPSSYKYYVKRYFAKIHPTAAAEDAGPEGERDGGREGNTLDSSEDRTP